jgi:hypothetical protein
MKEKKKTTKRSSTFPDILWNNHIVKKGYSLPGNTSRIIQDAILEKGNYSKIDPDEYEKLKKAFIDLSKKNRELGTDHEIYRNANEAYYNASKEDNFKLKAKLELLENKKEKRVSELIKKIEDQHEKQLEDNSRLHEELLGDNNRLREALRNHGNQVKLEYKKSKKIWTMTWWKFLGIVAIIFLIFAGMTVGSFFALEAWRTSEYKNKLIKEVGKEYKIVKKIN